MKLSGLGTFVIPHFQAVKKTKVYPGEPYYLDCDGTLETRKAMGGRIEIVVPTQKPGTWSANWASLSCRRYVQQGGKPYFFDAPWLRLWESDGTLPNLVAPSPDRARALKKALQKIRV